MHKHCCASTVAILWPGDVKDGSFSMPLRAMGTQLSWRLELLPSNETIDCGTRACIVCWWNRFEAYKCKEDSQYDWSLSGASKSAQWCKSLAVSWLDFEAHGYGAWRPGRTHDLPKPETQHACCFGFWQSIDQDAMFKTQPTPALYTCSKH